MKPVESKESRHKTLFIVTDFMHKNDENVLYIMRFKKKKSSWNIF